MNPLTRRRVQVFKSDRRGYYSLWILGVMIVTSMFAELLCNTKPIYVYYQGKHYLPMLKDYPETTFGGIFETPTDYNDPSILAELKRDGNRVLFPPVRFDYAYVDTSLSTPAPAPPDGKHLLGTDDRSRDVFARLVYGFRLSILFGISLTAFGTVIGILVGAVAGFFGGWVDLALQRLTEIWSSQNELYLLIILSSIFEPSLTVIFCLFSLFGWMGLAAYVRAEFLRARQLDFVLTAAALGASNGRIVAKHIIPNTLTPVITFLPFRISTGIMGLTALDFLGLGVPPPTASLGELLSQGKAHLQSWWIILSTFTLLTVTILLLNFIGEAARRANDPKAFVTTPLGT